MLGFGVSKLGFVVLVHFCRSPASPKFPNGSQIDPLEGQPVRYEVLAGLDPKGGWASGFGNWAPRIWPEGRPRGPAEGGRGEVNLPNGF